MWCSYWKGKYYLVSPPSKFRLEKTDLGFPKTFYGGYVFVFAVYLCNRSLKMTAKHIKNYISILAIVNYRKWLDASPFLLSILFVFCNVGTCQSNIKSKFFRESLLTGSYVGDGWQSFYCRFKLYLFNDQQSAKVKIR